MSKTISLENRPRHSQKTFGWLILLLFAFLYTGCGRGSTSDPQAGISPQPVICADNYAAAFVWEDLNANGVQDEGEPPLPNVCVAYGDSSLSEQTEWVPGWCGQNGLEGRPEALTDENGEWHTSSFVAGKCAAPEEVGRLMEIECNKVSIMAFPGPGYRVTTKEKVQGCRAEFGVVRETVEP